ncbi:hypothetical protein A0257_11650 [Hymenobacter psoromatis]|nr:hypothetical protein A0257_11650 [Hymenobacter psoromatis]
MVITGSGFAGTTAVSIQGSPVAAFTVNSDTQLTATLSSSQATGQVLVTTPNGIGTSSGSFRVGPVLIVVRGNSQANGATTTGNASTIGSSTTGAWPDQAAALLGSGYVWQNRSKNGATIDYLRLSDDTEVAPLFGTGNYGEEWIVLQETTNQIFQANPAQQVYGKMVAWAQYWKSKGVKVAVVTCYATQDPQYNAEIDAINDLYRANWASFCDMLLDVKSSPYVTQTGMDPQYGYCSDGLHLNTPGNQIPAHCAVDGFNSRPRTGLIPATFMLPGIAVPGSGQPAPAPAPEPIPTPAGPAVLRVRYGTTAADYVTGSSGEIVRRLDQSGASRNAVVTAGHAGPRLVADDGQQVAQYNAGTPSPSQSMTVTDALAANSDASIVVDIRLLANGFNSVISVGGDLSIWFQNTTKLQVFDKGSNFVTSLDLGTAPLTRCILTFNATTNELIVYAHDTETYRTTLPGLPWVGSTPVVDMELGGYLNGTNPLAGEMGAIAVYSGLLSAAERSDWFAVTPTLVPAISSFSQSPAGRGQVVTVTGANLANTTSLVVNGVDATATITANTATSLTFKVPTAAPDAGTTILTTATGMASSIALFVRAAPGSALAFDGVDDYVGFANPTPAVSNLGASAFTLEAWVYYDGTVAVNSLIRKSGDYNLYLNSGKLTAEVWTGGLGTIAARSVASTSTVPTNRWTHVAAVWDKAANRFDLYENGVADVVSSSSFTAASSESLTIGATVAYGGNYLRGRLDELRIWSTARSITQIMADLQTLPTLPQTDLAMYLNFDQGAPTSNNTSQITLDELVNSYDGTLNGFDLSSSSITSNYVASYALVVPTATAATNVAATSFTATWQASGLGQADSYLVEVATTADFVTPLAGSPFSVAAPVTSLDVAGLARNTTYYYRVAAQSASLLNQGARSNETTVATPLPVELIAFTAQPSADQATVCLAWSTATEKSSARFEAERSTDGAAFTHLATVAAAGTGTVAHSYSFIDGQLPGAVLYYRLRQVDIDGSATYSPVRTVRLALGSGNLVLFPNPASANTLLKNAVPNVPVQVLDALGRIVATATADAVGTAPLVLPAGLVRGVYIVRAGVRSCRLLVE